jgi:UDP-glucose 4-epimerase
LAKEKVLITGGAGFIGSNLVDACIEDGYEVVVIDNLSTGKKQNIHPKAKFYQIDVTDPGLKEIFEEEKPGIVSHHAAQPSAQRSITEPIFDAKTNILGTINVVSNAVNSKVRKITFASSVAVYGHQRCFPADEKHPLGLVNPYGVAKSAAERYIRYFCQDSEVTSYTIFRYANVYGPRQDPFGEGGVVAIFSQKLVAGESPIINGDGKQTRDFVYVGDIVKANLLAFQSARGGTFNLSTGREVSVVNLFSAISEIVDDQLKPIFGPPKTGDQRRSLIDPSKANQVLGWRASTDLNFGLKATIKYFSSDKIVTAQK